MMNLFWKYIFPCIFGLMIYTSIRLVNDTHGGFEFWKRPIVTNAIEIGTVILVSYLIQFILDFFIRRFNRQKQNSILTTGTVLREFIIVYLACAALLNATVVPMAALTDDGLQLSDFVMINIVPVLYILLYFAIVRGNHYLKAYVDNKLQLEKITNDQLQTELKFLKAQYHPHFLFNALNTIYFQMDESIEAAKNSVEKFSELLRYQIYDQQQTVPIRSEIQYLQNFIELQKVRTSNRLTLVVDLSSALNEQKIYPLLLLPLVENAFKYVGGDYHIQITAAIQDDVLVFEVINSIPKQTTPKKPGIGLENLKRRLTLLYPGSHDLDLKKDETHFAASLKLKLDGYRIGEMVDRTNLHVHEHH